jgi:phosphatidylinositol alpha-1,6-mannosyltransferase
MRIVYLATGVFDKGGISRYSRYQIRALRDLMGDNQIYVLSLLGAGPNDFEEPFTVHYHGNGTSAISKAKYALAAARTCFSTKLAVIWCNHLHLLPLGLVLC